MSDFVFRLDLRAVFNNPPATEEARFEALAYLISRRLDSMVEIMEDRGYIFEASSTETLAMKFFDFAEGLDTTCHNFSRLWDELCDWAEISVPSGRREKSLCNIPSLPQEFSC